MFYIKYKVEFKIKIIGCNLNFKVERNILDLLSTDDIKLTSIVFENDKQTNTMKGTIETSNFKDSYTFVLFELKELIIKTLSITSEIENLRVKDNIKFSILNKNEIIKAGLPVDEFAVKFMTLNPEIPDISKKEFQQNFKGLYKVDEKISEILFWQYLSYSTPNISKGKTKFDFISQYRLLWSSFNSLYKQLFDNKYTERQCLEKYSQKDYVVEYFSHLLKNYDLYASLEKIKEQNLYLKHGKESVSEKLIKSLREENNENISKYSILCLYAIRNSIIHGSFEEEINLCREGFTLLNPLVKITVKKELLNFK